MNKKEIPQKSPYILEVEPGRYLWCSCGRSKEQPFCDRKSHIGTEFRPKLQRITEKKKVAWCGCKHTENPPFCDGFHQTFKNEE